MTIVLTTHHEESIRGYAESAYPGECCGVFIGRIVNGLKYVSVVLPLINSHEDGPARRFRVDPRDLLSAERLARKTQDSLVGFFHSHPDVAPVPSEYDRTHAWETYSYLIVECGGSGSQAMRSWQLDDNGANFNEEKIVFSDSAVELSPNRLHNEEPAHGAAPL